MTLDIFQKSAHKLFISAAPVVDSSTITSTGRGTVFERGGIVAAVSFLKKVLVIAAILLGIANVSPATAHVADLPELPGLIRGTGTDFALPNSPYLPVTLHSSVSVTLILSSVPEIVDLTIIADPAAGSAEFTLGGFAPDTLYYRYADNDLNPVTFFTDSTGNFTYTQDLSRSHHVWFRDRPSTLHLDATDSHGDCDLVGDWSPATMTCTLTMDVEQELHILASGLTLDGAGFRVLPPVGWTLGYAVKSESFSNVIIKKLNISGSTYGIYATKGNNITVTNNSISGATYGIWTAGTADQEVFVTNNTISNPKSYGILHSDVRISIDGNNISYLRSYPDSLGYDGIFSIYGSSASLTNNSISGFGSGISALFIDRLLMKNNTISNSTKQGLYIGYSLRHGTVYNNNFIDNMKQIACDFPYDDTAVTDFNLVRPDGGNFYSDYSWSCNDSDGDGFCSPYTIGESWLNGLFLGSWSDNLPWKIQNGWSSVEPNVPPEANAGGPYSGFEGSFIPIVGTGTDDNGDLLTFLWSVESGSGCIVDDVGSATTQLNCTDNGTFDLSFEVNDFRGSPTIVTTTVTVSNVAPIVDSPVLSPERSIVDELVTASATFSDPGTNDGPFTCTVDFGDGTTSPGTVDGAVCSASHDYSAVGEYGVTVTVTDRDGDAGSSTSRHVVSDDTTAPVITAAHLTVEATGPLTPVTCTATATDAVGVVSLTSNAPAVFPVGTTTITWTAKDAAGNTGTATSTVTVVDTTAPVITAANVTVEATGPQTPVTGTATAMDTVDGAISLTSNAPATFPVGTTSITWTAKDTAGNTGTATSTVTVVDTTAPVITAANVTVEATGPQTPVTGTATAMDTVDGAVSLTSDAPATFPVGTTTITLTAKDAAGNTGTATITVTVKDTTPPVISNSPADIQVVATAASGSIVTYANPAASDNVDGAVATDCIPASGSTLLPSTTQVNCTAADALSNTSFTSFTVSVNYDWSGFFQPVENLPVVNTVKAGSAIPVKFSLGGDMGLDIFAVGYPKVVSIIAATGEEVPIDETVTAGGSSLNYDPLTNRYIYVWKSARSWVGNSYQLQLKLKDGTIHVANFKFK